MEEEVAELRHLYILAKEDYNAYILEHEVDGIYDDNYEAPEVLNLKEAWKMSKKRYKCKKKELDEMNAVYNKAYTEAETKSVAKTTTIESASANVNAIFETVPFLQEQASSAIQITAQEETGSEIEKKTEKKLGITQETEKKNDANKYSMMEETNQVNEVVEVEDKIMQNEVTKELMSKEELKELEIRKKRRIRQSQAEATANALRKILEEEKKLAKDRAEQEKLSLLNK